MTTKQLQEKREKLVADARAALDDIRKNTDDARAAELEQRHDTIMADFDKVEADIKREERMAEAERRTEESRARNRPNPGDGEARGDDDPDKPVEYRQAFHRWVASGGDFSALSNEERAALRAGVAPKEARAQTAGTAAAGGYTVPTELSNQIIRSIKAWGPMYDENIITEISSTSGNPIDMPTVDDTDKDVEKHTEAGPVPDDGSADAVFGKKTLSAYSYDTKWVKFSWELAQDSIFNFETLLGDLLGERLGRRANRELTIGAGAGNPAGIAAASSLGVTAATATAITFDNIIDLEHSVDPAYRQSPKARYMFNDTTLNAVRKLKDNEGRYIWSAGDVQKGVPSALNGRAYSINQAMDSIAAAKRIMLFGDLSKYFVRKVGKIVIFVARERFAPDVGLLGLVRFDGALGDNAAVKHLITAAA